MVESCLGCYHSSREIQDLHGLDGGDGGGWSGLHGLGDDFHRRWGLYRETRRFPCLHVDHVGDEGRGRDLDLGGLGCLSRDCSYFHGCRCHRSLCRYDPYLGWKAFLIVFDFDFDFDLGGHHHHQEFYLKSPFATFVVRSPTILWVSPIL